jgi:hypothetical protein
VKPILLLIGGFIQVLIVFLHIGIFFGIASSTDLSATSKVSVHIFNAAVLATVMFFAYVSLFRRKEIIDTTLGKTVAVFIVIFYIQRALVEVFLRGVDWFILGLALAIAALYIIPILPSPRISEKQ